MRIDISEIDGKLMVRISSTEIAERRFLRQLLEYGASVELSEDKPYWTHMDVVGNSPVDAELSELNEMLS